MSTAPKHLEPIDVAGWRRQAIAHRLRLRNGDMLPFDGMETLLGDDSVYVMVVVNGKGAMFNDDKTLFPSDTLITQLLLVAK